MDTAPLLKLEANSNEGSPGKSNLSAKIPNKIEKMKTIESNKLPVFISTDLPQVYILRPIVNKPIKGAP